MSGVCDYSSETRANGLCSKMNVLLSSFPSARSGLLVSVWVRSPSRATARCVGAVLPFDQVLCCPASSSLLILYPSKVCL